MIVFWRLFIIIILNILNTMYIKCIVEIYCQMHDMTPLDHLAFWTLIIGIEQYSNFKYYYM